MYSRNGGSYEFSVVSGTYDKSKAYDGRKYQIVNINLNDIDDDFAKVLTKIYSRLIFDFAKGLKNRGSIPFHIILEEAHRYIQNDNDRFLLGYVIDYLQLSFFSPVCNFADYCISIGTVLLVIYLLFFSDMKDEKKIDKKSEEN